MPVPFILVTYASFLKENRRISFQNIHGRHCFSTKLIFEGKKENLSLAPQPPPQFLVGSSRKLPCIQTQIYVCDNFFSVVCVRARMRACVCALYLRLWSLSLWRTARMRPQGQEWGSQLKRKGKDLLRIFVISSLNSTLLLSTPCSRVQTTKQSMYRRPKGFDVIINRT